MITCFFSKPKSGSKRVDNASLSNRQLNAAQNKHQKAKNNLRVFCTQKWKNLVTSLDDRGKAQKKPRLKAEPTISINIQNQHAKTCKTVRPEDKSFRQGVHGNGKNSHYSPQAVLANQKITAAPHMPLISRSLAYPRSGLKAKVLSGLKAKALSGLKAKALRWAGFFSHKKQVILKNKNPVVSMPKARK